MTRQVQCELFCIPLAFSSPILTKTLLNHTLEQSCSQFLFIWCQKHRIGIYDLLAKGLGLSLLRYMRELGGGGRRADQAILVA